MISRRIAGASAGFLVGLTITAFFAGATHSRSVPSRAVALDGTGNERASEMTKLLDESPLIGGKEGTLPEAESLMPFKLVRPTDPLASDALISGVWTLIEPDYAATAIEYASGVTIVLRAEEIGTIPTRTPSPGESYGEEFGEMSNDPPGSFDDLAKRLAAQSAESFGTSPDDWLASVKDGLAYVIPYEPLVHRATVLFSFEGVRVRVYGDMALSLLLRVANSFSPSP
jgi:hypothetical protein